MPEITKQYFDKQLGKLATKDDIKDVKSLVKTEVGRLDTKIGRLEMKIETEVAELAAMTSKRFDELEAKLDVKKEVEGLGKRVFRVEQALNIKN